MVLLHCTDLHFRQEWFNWVAQQHEQYDILCITGDFLDITHKTPLQEQIAWVKEWCKAIHKPFFVCSGNHDYDERDSLAWLNNIPNVYGDGTIKTIDGITFGCIPYLATEYDSFDTCTVLLSHLPPAKTKTAMDQKTKKDWGDIDLSRLLYNNLLRPKVLLCGHVHEPFSTQDKVNECTIHNNGVRNISELQQVSTICI